MLHVFDIYNVFVPGFLGDLYTYSPASNKWTQLAPPAPSPRCDLGFVSTSDGRLWVFGGKGATGACVRKRSAGPV